jgi:hypothetical protein
MPAEHANLPNGSANGDAASRQPAAARAEPSDDELGAPRKKQKRNKPTLSCEECVERKTKVSL